MLKIPLTSLDARHYMLTKPRIQSSVSVFLLFQCLSKVSINSSLSQEKISRAWIRKEKKILAIRVYNTIPRLLQISWLSSSRNAHYSKREKGEKKKTATKIKSNSLHAEIFFFFFSYSYVYKTASRKNQLLPSSFRSLYGHSFHRLWKYIYMFVYGFSHVCLLYIARTRPRESITINEENSMLYAYTEWLFSRDDRVVLHLVKSKNISTTSRQRITLNLSFTFRDTNIRWPNFNKLKMINCILI